jgi:hypothetical protein
MSAKAAKRYFVVGRQTEGKRITKKLKLLNKMCVRCGCKAWGYLPSVLGKI